MKSTIKYELCPDSRADRQGCYQLWMTVVDAVGLPIASDVVAEIENGERAAALVRFLHAGGQIEIPKNERDGIAHLWGVGDDGVFVSSVAVTQAPRLLGSAAYPRPDTRRGATSRSNRQR